jgi:cation diffusion facilitator CzcD-associated flavoprotein CzcO
MAALQVLTHRGFAVECFERTDRVGGHWHTDYDSLHLITSRDVSGFAGYPPGQEGCDPVEASVPVRTECATAT